jgi:uncharacterized metal-binding protein YceD (DUF177 family)
MTPTPPESGPVPEFSRPIAVDKLAAAGSRFTIEASAEERAALARRYGIIAVDALTAVLSLRSGAKGTVRLEGQLEAEVRQACIVSLAEVPARIEQKFARVYAPEATGEEAEVTVELEAEDPPDPLIDGAVDLGEAVAEELALALDPYPRAPGVVFEAVTDDEPEPPSPFAALAALKKGK